MRDSTAVFLLAVIACVGAKADGVRISEKFGFDAVDSTRFIQAALDSGAQEVVLDRTGKPWVSCPLKAHSDLRIVFEDGVELVAKKGEFRGTHDSLLCLQSLTNVVVCGRGRDGGVMRMHKRDYVKGPYEPSEHRHLLCVYACKGVRVENMRMQSSGGDGIVVGDNSRNVTIRKVVCDDNHRQGISVLSAIDLLIEDCVLKNTGGTLPMAGIDWEPWRVVDSLVNCTMRRCLVENNAGNGIEFYLGDSTGKTRPIDVLVEDCRVVGCKCSAAVGGGVGKKSSYPQGKIVYRNCRFESPREAGISIRSKPLNAFRVLFENCVVSNANGTADVIIGTERWDQPPVDGVEFPGLKTVRTKPGKTFGRIGFGTCPEKSLPPRREFLPEDRVEVVDRCPGKRVPLSPAVLQDRARYVFFADRAGRVSFVARRIQRTRTAPSASGSLRVSRMILPGHPRWTKEIQVTGLTGQVVEFDVPERGYYFMSGPVSGLTRFVLEESDVPVGLNVSTEIPLVLPPQGDDPLSLWVSAPKGGFACLLAGCDASCKVKAAVYGPDGTLRVCEDSIYRWTPLKVGAEKGGLFRLDVMRPSTGDYFAVQLDLVGVPSLLHLSSEKFIRPKQLQENR